MERGRGSSGAGLLPLPSALRWPGAAFRPQEHEGRHIQPVPFGARKYWHCPCFACLLLPPTKSLQPQHSVYPFLLDSAPLLCWLAILGECVGFDLWAPTWGSPPRVPRLMGTLTLLAPAGLGLSWEGPGSSFPPCPRHHWPEPEDPAGPLAVAAPSCSVMGGTPAGDSAGGEGRRGFPRVSLWQASKGKDPVWGAWVPHPPLDGGTYWLSSGS